ncbi:MAG: SMI1/KNR4 family protein [Planctomycetaceae bacterium]|nr:SMI1/KNR4 family protein [Planctomycetaceae bacterium]
MSTFENANKMLQRLVEAGLLHPKPGLSLEQIKEAEKKFDLTLPPSVVEWLTYCNGQRKFMAWGNMHELDDITCHAVHTPHWKNRGWTPVGTDGCGSYYLVIKHETSEGTLYPVIFADKEHTFIYEGEVSVFEEQGLFCDHISYVVASDLPHFLEGVFLYEEHRKKYWDGDEYEYLNFWWPFDKKRVREFDPDIEKIGIITPWDARIQSIRLSVFLWSLYEKDREKARKRLLEAVELAKEDNYVSNEMVYNIDALAENGFIRDTLNVIRSLPPSYERAHSFCYITFCKSEHFDCTPEEVVETALDIAEEGFNMLGSALPPDKCDRYFAHYVDNIYVLINAFADERNLQNAETYLSRLWQLVRQLTDPMDRILSFIGISHGFCRNGNDSIAKTMIDEIMQMVSQADTSLWDKYEFYDDNPLTYENVISWVERVKKELVKS